MASNRTGELADGRGQRLRELLDDRLGRADPFVFELVSLDRERAGRIPQQRGHSDRGGRLEGAVVRARAQGGEELRGRGLERWSERAQHDVSRVNHAVRQPFDRRARLTQGQRVRVDRERGLVAEQVADDDRQHEGQLGLDGGDDDDMGRGREAGLLAAVNDDDRGGLVRGEDRHLLGRVIRCGARQPGRADEHERFG